VRSPGDESVTTWRRTGTLLVDAVINLLLGVLLVMLDPRIADTLGVPAPGSRFYTSILGVVLIGVAIALVIEALQSPPREGTGLGLLGAVCINLCGGVALGLWLSFGDLGLPVRGLVFLWCLVVALVVLSGIELVTTLRGDGRT
jgi:hypothetical protein